MRAMLTCKLKMTTSAVDTASRLSPELTPSNRRRYLQLAGGLLGTLALPAPPAFALQAPKGPIQLTLSGRLRSPNHGVLAHFDMAMLAALPQQSFMSRTPWFGQARKFTGPLLSAVLASAGAEGSLMRLGALNDYHIEMPVEEAQRLKVLVARLLDDQPMAVRDKGPLLVMYPFDSRPELRSALYYSRSIWQLRTIDVS